MTKVNMVEYFSILPDPRVERTKKHLLIDIVVIAVCAVISGMETWVDIAEFGEAREEWFRKFLKLPNGIPSHDTFARVFSLLDPDRFREIFYQWVRLVFNISENEIIAIDGKFVGSSANSRKVNSHFGLVNAWATRAGVALAQTRIEHGKKDEKQAFRELIEFLRLKGAIVSIDANGCHADIANKIVAKGGDYFLALKRNQKSLYKQAASLFSAPSDEMDRFQTSYEKDHGRIERRECLALNLDDRFKEALASKNNKRYQTHWDKITSICQVRSERTIGAKTTMETRYYISSLKANAEQMLNLSRSHWEIENKLHWTLDVSFNEDKCRSRKGHLGENFALLRQLALNLIKAETTSKLSLRARRKKCSYDETYFTKVLINSVCLPENESPPVNIF